MKRAFLLGPAFLALVHCGPSLSTEGVGQAVPTIDDDAGSVPETVVAFDAGPTPEASAMVDANAARPPADAGALPAKDAGAVTDASDGGSPDSGCAGAVDDPDDNGVDSNCDGADGVVGRDVYVDTMSGEDTNAGTPRAPLKTLPAALTLASSRQGRVLVDTGTIALAQDTLAAAGTWSVFGGYTSTFLGAPDRTRTVFQPSANGLLVDLATSARLAHVSILAGPPAPGATSLAAQALRSRAAMLALDDVDVEAANALPGANGNPGTSFLQDKDATCHGVAKPSYAQGAFSGEPGPAGTAPGSVTFAGTVLQGLPAAPPMTGAPGTDGADATGTLSLTGDLVVAASGTGGQSDGQVGYGGAGGASFALTTVGIQLYGGSGGVGGCPGVGGSAGQSGGSSVAIVVLAGAVNVTRSRIVAGLAGVGGDGGQGQPGQLGNPGSAPLLISLTDGVLPYAVPPSCSGLMDDPWLDSCASWGGPGGQGGTGGHGGGGAGGWSIGVLQAVGATSTVDSATTIRPGKAGLGGFGNGGGYAPAGQALSVYALAQ